MQIREPEGVPFESVGINEVFKYNDRVFIKMDVLMSGEGERFNALAVSSPGGQFFVSDETKVIYYPRATLVLEPSED